MGLDKIDGLDITESDALRVAVANVTLDNPPIGGVKIHGAERTNADAGTAADTGIIVNRYPSQFFILGYRFYRAHIQAGMVVVHRTVR